MTEIRQEHHHTIHAEDAKEVKPWRLPFWTEQPVWVSHKTERDIRAPQRHPQIETEPEQPVADSGAEVAADEALALPTAEELENIRRQAYNDGLEQGLVEGRQQGHKDGYEAGRKEGYDAAFQQGHDEGRKEGFRTGEEEGRRKAQADVNTVVGRLERIIRHLHSHLHERDQQMPEVLASLVAGMCAQVLGHELQHGAVNILQFVQRALAELPEGEDKIQVFVGPDDARHLQNSLDTSGTELHYRVDDKLPAGACRVESEHSLVEYSSHEYLNQLLEQVLTQMMHQSISFPDAGEQQQWDEPLPGTLSAAEPVSRQAETADVADSLAADTPADAGSNAIAPADEAAAESPAAEAGIAAAAQEDPHEPQ